MEINDLTTNAAPSSALNIELSDGTKATLASLPAPDSVATLLAGKETAGAAATVQGNLDTHTADTAPHGATASNTASRIVTRNAGGTFTISGIQLDTAAAPTSATGLIRWNDVDRTAEIVTEGGVVLQLGQEETVYVRNNSGVALVEGDAVYITGSSGQRTTVAKVQANSALAQKTIGLVTTTGGIADNAFGFVTLAGLVRDINTVAYAEGTELWLSPTTAGALTATVPTADTHRVVRIGYVVRSHATQGMIMVATHYHGTVLSNALMEAEGAEAGRTVLGATTAAAALAAADAADTAVLVSAKSLAVGNSVAFFGDSITNYGEGYPYYAGALSMGVIQINSVQSNAGFTTTALLAVTDQITNLSPLPKMVVLLAGTNDAIGGTPISTFKDNVITIIGRFKAVGIAPVLCTIPPLTGAQNILARRYNSWIKRYSSESGFVVIDMYSALADPATGVMISAYDSGDGIHPTAAGSVVMGQKTATVLASVMGTPTLLVSEANTGGTNLISNSWMLNDTNSDGIADSWAATPSAGFAYSRILDESGRGFYWQRITLTGNPGNKQLIGTPISYGGSTFEAGDRLLIAARIRSGQSNASALMRLQFTFYNDSYGNAQNVIMPCPVGTTQLIGDGIISTEVIVPTERTIGLFTFLVGTASGTYDFSQPTIVNLTKNGVV